MAATPGSGGPGGSAGGMTYRDKTVKAHDKFWPEVDTVEPLLTDLKSKLHELSQSHLTMAPRESNSEPRIPGAFITKNRAYPIHNEGDGGDAQSDDAQCDTNMDLSASVSAFCRFLSR